MSSKTLPNGQSSNLLGILLVMKSEWENLDGTLRKTFTFSDFREALSFVNKVGKLAEEFNHHPDICIKNYNKVSISTTTHDAENKLTDRDYQITKAIDELL